VPETRTLDYIADGLSVDGHEIHRAESIEDIFEQLSEERFDVVVAGIFEPLFEGVAVFATINRSLPKTRVIALTDYRSAHAETYDLSLWVDSVISKPFTIDRVRNEIEWVLTSPAVTKPLTPVA
jgi:DNA-binding response OmpR family regulator